MNFIINMNLSPTWAELLRNADISARHWSDVGCRNASDTVIAEWARDNDAIVLTADLDFGKIVILGGHRWPSVLQLRCEDTRHTMIGAAVVAAIKAETTALRNGAFVTFDGQRARTRQLPSRGD